MNPTIANFDVQQGNDATFTVYLSPAMSVSGFTLQAKIQKVSGSLGTLLGTEPIASSENTVLTKSVTTVDATFGVLTFSLAAANTTEPCLMAWQIQRTDSGHVTLLASGYISVNPGI